MDNSDTANVAATGAWTRDDTGSGYQGFDYHTAPAGTGTSHFTWTPVVPADGTYEVFARYPSDVTGAASDATYTVDTGTTQTPVTVDQTQGGGTWVSLGRHQLTAGTATHITLTDNADGTVLADAVKLVRDNTGEPDTEAKTFSHSYDPNANLTTLSDSSPGAAVDTYQLTYNGLNQLTTVEEKLATVVKNTTSYSYNENGAITTRDHDRQDSVFDYTTRDLLATVTNTETGGTPQVTVFSYTPRGQIDGETKANGNTVDHGYHLDGALASQVEKKTDGTLVSQHLIEYTANGNRATDATKIQNADNHTAYLDHIYHYSYDPRERLTQVQKKTTGGTVVETETYRHDANNNVIDQTVDGTHTTFAYDRNRLTTTTSAGGATAGYNYDPFGRLDTVISAGQIIEQFVYDGFDRTTTHRKRDTSGTLLSTTYRYDPLDRTAAKTDKAGTPDAETTDFAYLGLSDKVVAEQIAGQLQRTYQYDAYGRRLTQQRKDTDGGGPQVAEDTYYGYNPHTDVETLTTASGDTTATYGYTAYGTDDTEAFTGIDKPDTQNPDKEPFNYYRYTGKRFDPASGSYDMGFRDYNPAINRFTVRDTYNGALADMNLGTNPWTGNRYTMAGGNPITGIEIDGHCPLDACGVGTPLGDGRVSTTGPADPGNSDAGYYQNGTYVAPAKPMDGYLHDVGVTRVIAPDTATYANAYQAASREFKDRFGDDALTGIHCTSPDTNSCGYGLLTHATEFGQAMCRQTGMTCGDQNTFARIMAMAAAGGMMSGGKDGSMSVMSGRVGRPTSPLDMVRLRDQLHREEYASLFNRDGTLTHDALSQGERIMEATDLGNDALKSALTSDGSRLGDWGKYSIARRMPGYGSIEVHYYYNPVTDRVNYNFDYKTKRVG
ncbi:RHS repeat-associated core domain-containing protein [Actinophytocola sp.]|uniref:golvesin C-terminal-like domain-containing protein n=1 Tax=Actinophytocola sp. TaxID=1872138 RepID=UPI0025BEB081|nr:RHS repeat-associated core domain-containing protein [Actinophytocola sp.]